MSGLVSFHYRELVQAVEQRGGRVRIRLSPRQVVVKVHCDRR